MNCECDATRGYVDPDCMKHLAWDLDRLAELHEWLEDEGKVQQLHADALLRVIHRAQRWIGSTASRRPSPNDPKGDR